MSRFRDEINSYLSVPGAFCMVAAGWLYLAANHVNEEARRVSQAYVVDSLSGMSVSEGSVRLNITNFTRMMPLLQRGGQESVRQSQCGCLQTSRRLTALLLLCVDARKLERLLPMLVALRGRVESNDPRKCELSDRKAVIHEVGACQGHSSGATCGAQAYCARQFSCLPYLSVSKAEDTNMHARAAAAAVVFAQL